MDPVCEVCGDDANFIQTCEECDWDYGECCQSREEGICTDCYGNNGHDKEETDPEN